MKIKENSYDRHLHSCRKLFRACASQIYMDIEVLLEKKYHYKRSTKIGKDWQQESILPSNLHVCVSRQPCIVLETGN